MEKNPSTKKLLWAGLTGSIIVTLCCFTPILVLLLGAIGLGAVTGYLDYVLLPMLAVFLGITVYGLHRQHCTTGRHCCTKTPGKTEVNEECES